MFAGFIKQGWVVGALSLSLLGCGGAALQMDEQGADGEQEEAGVNAPRLIQLEAIVDFGRGTRGGAPTDEKYVVDIDLSVSRNVPATRTHAYLFRGTQGEGGGPGTEFYTCNTEVTFPLGQTAVSVATESTGQFVHAASKQLEVTVFFSSPAHANSRCQPHNFPSFEREANVGVWDQAAKVPLAAGGFGFIGGFGYSVNLKLKVVQRDGVYYLEDAEDYAQPPFSGLLGVQSVGWYRADSERGPAVERGFSPLRRNDTYRHHVVRSNVFIESCDRRTKTGEVQYFVDYKNFLPNGSRVFIKYTAGDEFMGKFGQSLDPWTDDKIVELTRRGHYWQGVVRVRPEVVEVFSSPFPTPPAGSLGRASFRKPSSGFSGNTRHTLHYVFRIQREDGTVVDENGSSSRWGNYIADTGESQTVCSPNDSFTHDPTFGTRVVVY